MNRPKWKQALQNGYLKQCGEPLNEQSILNYGLDDNNMELLFENDTLFIIKYQDEKELSFINIVNKREQIIIHTLEM